MGSKWVPGAKAEAAKRETLCFALCREELQDLEMLCCGKALQAGPGPDPEVKSHCL